MGFLLTETIIRQLCGDASYKKGEADYLAGKVTLNHDITDSPVVEASVKGKGDFHVTLQNDRKGDIQAQCTCPTLASFDTYCHHIAAVLRCIQDVQRKDGHLANEVMSLFENPSNRSRGHQDHVESRKKLQVEFICKPVNLHSGGHLFGIEVKVGVDPLDRVQALRDFLDHITYYPELYSFQKETNAVLRELINIYQNEKVYLNTFEGHSLHDKDQGQMMLIPPSAWEVLFPLLLAAPSVHLEHDGSTFDQLRLSDERLPLHFEFEKATVTGYQLDVKGLHQLTVLESYGYVLSEGDMIRLTEKDCKRLVELKQMLDHSGEHRFSIPPENMEHFVETVLPGFMKLGHVRIDQAVSQWLGKTPLKAKLYLDRVKNRLLAGLEFHYGNMVIHPLEESGSASGPTLMRDGEKERRILQMMEESLFTQTEGGYYLHNEEAEYVFLYHIVPTLKEFVEIYATTAVKLRLHKGNAAPMVKVEVDERTDWLSFQIDIQGIPEAEIRELMLTLEEKRKYYRMANGSLLSLETENFKKLNQFIDQTGLSEKDVHKEEIRLPLMSGIQWIHSLQEGEILSKGEAINKLMEDLQHPDKLEFVVPAHLNSVLRDYQKDGFRWLKMLATYQFGGILADDMGLGKTIQSIAFMVTVLPELRAQKRPAMIVCPSSVVYNWMNELKKFAPEIRALIVDGGRSQRSKILRDQFEADVIITSYPLLRRDAALYGKQAFHTIIFDEAQAFKNDNTQTAKAVKMLQADHRFALTGTPIENSIQELWSIFHVVFPKLLPSKQAFKELTRESVARRIRPFLLRRMKEDVLAELPEKIETIQTSELNLDQKKLYAAYLVKLKQEALKHIGKGTLQKNQIKILAGLTRLRQLCCHPALFVEGYKGSSAKMEQLMEILEECRSTGKRVLIFSQFTKMLGIMGRQLGSKGWSYFYLDGQTPSSERVELCTRFNQGEQDLFLVSLKAGGTGLNLTGADTVILYDLWWNPAVEQQAADRAHRMGQKNKVQVIRLIAQGTIEDKMNELQERKRNLIGEVIQSRQEKGYAITEQELKDILLID